MAVPKAAVWKQMSALIPVYMNTLMTGCSIGWLPNAIYFLLLGKEVQGTYSECALVASFFDIAKVVFAIPAGILADKYGGKKSTISVAILNLMASLGILLNTSIPMIYTARFVFGLGSALLDATSLTLIGEVASPEIRGQLSGISLIFMVIGTITPSIITITFQSYKSLSIGLTILSVISLISMYGMTETPHYLVTVSKLEKAQQTLRRIRPNYAENEVQDEFEKLNSYIRDEQTRKSELNWVQFFKLKSIRRPLTIGTLLLFFTYLTGGGMLTGSYVTIVFPSNAYIPTMYYPLIGQIFSLVLVISSSLYVDKYPRRSIFLYGAATTIVFNTICAFTIYLIEKQNLYVFQWVFLLGNVFVSSCFWMSLNPMTTAIKSEIYPQTVKGFGTSLTVLSQGFSAVIGFQLYVFFKLHSCLYFMYVIFSIGAIILFLEVYFFLPESGGVNLVDLQMKFKEKSKSNRQQDADVEEKFLE